MNDTTSEYSRLLRAEMDKGPISYARFAAQEAVSDHVRNAHGWLDAAVLALWLMVLSFCALRLHTRIEALEKAAPPPAEAPK